jgi:hypothetical protein
MARQLSIPEKHQLRVARKTLNMPDGILGMIGGMTKAEAKEVIHRLTGTPAVLRAAENRIKSSPWA